MAFPHSYPVSDHCDGRRFFNPRHNEHRTWLDVLRWRRTSRATPWPDRIALSPQPAAPAPAGDTVVCTWINHATFLLQSSHGNVLTDPVYSERVGPCGIIGPRRVHPPGLPFERLPTIDTILLSHDHYDHCDLPTLRKLARRDAPLAITPLGNGPLLRRAGFAPEKIVELDWWQSHSTPQGLMVTQTPARHWSNRLSGARNGRLWGGFHLNTGSKQIIFTGDTGYDPEFFTAIRQRLGAPDLALVPIGAYAPRWFMAPHHCNPGEAVQIHRDLEARRSVAMHWGTFQLTDEGREDPVTALEAAKLTQGVPVASFQVLLPGEWITA